MMSTNASDSFGYYVLLPEARRVTRLPMTPWTDAVSEPDTFWEESLEAVAGPDGSVVVLMEPAYNTSYPWVGFGSAPAKGEGTSAFLGYGVEDAHLRLERRRRALLRVVADLRRGLARRGVLRPRH